MDATSPRSSFTRRFILSAISRIEPCSDSKPVTSRYASSKPMGWRKGEKSARMAMNFLEAARYSGKLPGTKTASGQRRRAVTRGIPEWSPNLLAS